MPRIIDILEFVIQEIKTNNPYGLILKGGTALALYHLERHRESEDLDFDVPMEFKIKHEDIVIFLKGIFNSLVKKGIIYEADFKKEGFAKTDRYHMKLLIRTHRRDKGYFTKIDIDYIKEPKGIEKIENLCFYTLEKMLNLKLQTFSSRIELKDFFDIFHLIDHINTMDIENKEQIVEKINTILKIYNEKELLKIFRDQWRAMDLRFKSLKESQLKGFIRKAFKKLRRFKNQLSK